MIQEGEEQLMDKQSWVGWKRMTLPLRFALPQQRSSLTNSLAGTGGDVLVIYLAVQRAGGSDCLPSLHQDEAESQLLLFRFSNLRGKIA